MASGAFLISKCNSESFSTLTGLSWRRGKPSWSLWPFRSRNNWVPLPPTWRSSSNLWPPSCSPCLRTSRSRWRLWSRQWEIRPLPSATKWKRSASLADVPPHHHLLSWTEFIQLLVLDGWLDIREPKNVFQCLLMFDCSSCHKSTNKEKDLKQLLWWFHNVN